MTSGEMTGKSKNDKQEKEQISLNIKILVHTYAAIGKTNQITKMLLSPPLQRFPPR